MKCGSAKPGGYELEKDFTAIQMQDTDVGLHS